MSTVYGAFKNIEVICHIIGKPEISLYFRAKCLFNTFRPRAAGAKTMISSFTLKNFKSFACSTARLPRVGLLIGANASGKSNLIEAFRFVKTLAQGLRLDDMERMIQAGKMEIRGRVQDLFNRKNLPLGFGCVLSDAGREWPLLDLDIGLVNNRMTIVGEKIEGNCGNPPLYQIKSSQINDNDIVNVEYNNFKSEQNNPLIPCSNQQAIFYQLESPARFGASDVKSQRVIPEIAAKFRETLQKIFFLNPGPALMRSYSFREDTELREDASNISSVLATICKNKEKRKLLMEFARCLPEQDISNISFIQTERNDVMFRLHETFGGVTQKMDAPLLSDGTLRMLAVGSAMLGLPSGSLVIMEEIDNGLHPGRAEMLIKNIMNAAEKRNLQVLATTHNPALMNAIPDGELGNVLCCYRNATDGKSDITRLEDMKLFPELMAAGSLGKLVEENVLWKYLKNAHSDAQRREASLRWLKTLDEAISS